MSDDIQVYHRACRGYAGVPCAHDEATHYRDGKGDYGDCLALNCKCRGFADPEAKKPRAEQKK